MRILMFLLTAMLSYPNFAAAAGCFGAAEDQFYKSTIEILKTQGMTTILPIVRTISAPIAVIGYSSEEQYLVASGEFAASKGNSTQLVTTIAVSATYTKGTKCVPSNVKVEIREVR